MTGTAARQQLDLAGGAELGRISHWINGRIVEGGSGRRGPVFDPATGRQTKWVDFASTDEVDTAVAAAAAA
jgi:malonate-semialdehyde dehydrogenase (acetylating)/methylmalonate-semialdehyde dehydrogenase